MLDTILFAAITAFLKTQLGLKGMWVVIVAILVGSLFWFQPQISAYQPFLGNVVEYLKFVLAAPGLFDLSSNLGPRLFGPKNYK